MTGAKLSELLAETDAVDVPVGDKALRLTYRVLWDARISPEDWAKLKDLEVRDYYAEMLSRLVVSWDLTDDEGQPLPITREAFDQHQVPNRLLGTMVDAIMNRSVSGKVSATSSRAG